MGIEWISVIFHDMKIPGGSYVLKLGSMATSSSPPDEFANVISSGDKRNDLWTPKNPERPAPTDSSGKQVAHWGKPTDMHKSVFFLVEYQKNVRNQQSHQSW